MTHIKSESSASIEFPNNPTYTHCELVCGTHYTLRKTYSHCCQPPTPVEGSILYMIQPSILSHQLAIPCRRDLLNISPVLTDGAAAVVDDSFLRCFQSQGPDPWNWNVYLFPMWCIGVLVRYCILFPLRCELPPGTLDIFT